MQILFLVGAFLLGSFPTGVVVARAKGVDLRKVGSGNIGTTNVGRALGRGWAALVLLVDAGKGALPVVLAAQIFDPIWEPWKGSHALPRWFSAGEAGGLPTRLAWLPAAAGLVAVLGQVFSIFLKGRGGKGVATSLGAGLALAPVPALLCLVVWVVLFVAFRISSLGSLVAIASFPTFLWLFHAGSGPNLAFATATTLLVFLRHKHNIRRLLRGEELRG
jgi:glycerol-3-phosphate acyltransferase PlsY